MAGHMLMRVACGGRLLRSVSKKWGVLSANSDVKCLPSRSYSLQEKESQTSHGVGENEFVAPPSSPPDASTSQHIPVMAEEVLEFLAPQDGSVILDMTFGGGGHSRRLLAACPGVRLVCLDRDPLAHRLALTLQQEHPQQVLPLLGRFSDLPTLLTRLKIKRSFFDGVLMDLGVSSMQFGTAERGFMLSQDGPLDMRMDGGR